MNSVIEIDGEISDDLKFIAEKVALDVIFFMKQPDELEVAISFVSEDEIKRINNEFRNIDKVTDVLSFPLIDNPEKKKINKQNFPYDVDFDSEEICLGDILICKQVATAQAQEYGHSYDREVCYLLVHGIFHLLGYDHMEEDEKAEMRKREEQVLQKFNIKD